MPSGLESCLQRLQTLRGQVVSQDGGLAFAYTASMASLELNMQWGTPRAVPGLAGGRQCVLGTHMRLLYWQPMNCPGDGVGLDGTCAFCYDGEGVVVVGGGHAMLGAECGAWSLQVGIWQQWWYMRAWG